MVAWAVKNMGGTVPKTDKRALPDNMAELAYNCDLSSGALVGLPLPELIVDISTTPLATWVAANFPAAVNPKKAYRFPAPAGVVGSDVWIPLTSPFSSVCRSPLANDTSHRVYWTNPGDLAPHWSTYAMLAAGTGWYDLGIAQPTTRLTLTTSGGTTDGSVPYVARSYVFTYVNAYGDESAPSKPSAVVDGPPDATWNVAGLPTSVSNPGGYNYAPVVTINLYRTVTGATTGASFFFVTSFSVGHGSTYADTTLDTDIVGNITLPSSTWGNPPDFMDGLTQLPGGMLVGFNGNTIHFCEPDHPHSWPAAYDQSLDYDIVGFGVWQQSLVVLTSGFPSTGSGLAPSAFTFTTVRVPEPCLARGSIITDLMGVYYASQNGIVMLNYFGMQNQTLQFVTKNEWLTTFNAANIIACRHRSQYLAITGDGTGFLIDYSDQRMGIVQLSTFSGVTSVWNDEYSGDAYVIAGTKVYRWDSQNTGSQIYRWRSKLFFGPAPVSIGAIQIMCDPSILSTTPPASVPLGNGDTNLVLPGVVGGVNICAVFKLYAGQNQADLVMTRYLTDPREIFRVPGGFKAFDWQFEIVSCVKISSVELASTMAELKGV